MLSHPNTGLSLPPNHRDSDAFEKLTDWIELFCLTSGDSTISRGDIIDHIAEVGGYDEQDIAHNDLDEVMGMMGLRRRALSENYPLHPSNQSIKIDELGNRTAAYAFCLALSVVRFYEGVRKKLNYRTIGLAFEDLTHEVLSQASPHLTIELIGWSSQRTTKFPDVARSVGRMLHQQIRLEEGDEDRNDGGLDVICVPRFHDDRGGLSPLLVQCASGMNWLAKLDEPKVHLWERTTRDPGIYSRAIAIPFQLSNREFRKRNSEYKGHILDRMRLLTNHFGGFVSSDSRTSTYLSEYQKICRLVPYD